MTDKKIITPVKCTCLECGEEWEDEFDMQEQYFISLAFFCSLECQAKYIQKQVMRERSERLRAKKT